MQRDPWQGVGVFVVVPGLFFSFVNAGVVYVGGRQSVKIIKRINTNAALATDRNGKELIVLGKGVGFPKVPYELTDLSLVERTFYDVNPKYFSMIADIPQPVMLASAEITEQAELELGCELNPNLPFTLADHLNFAVERIRKGLQVTTPLAYDVKHLYPAESALGMQALDVLEQHAGIRLPDGEAVNIAMHLINAEAETDDIHATMLTLHVLEDVDRIVEKELDIRLNKEGFHYSRFAMHMRYLIQRLMRGEADEKCGGSMLRSVAREYPDIYACAQKVSAYLSSEHGWTCNEEETLFLMLHINRVRESDEE